MAIKKNDPPKKGKTTLGAGTGTGIAKYSAENAKQKAIKEAARKSAAAAVAKKPAAKKPAPAPKKAAAPAPAPKKAAAPAPAPAPAVAAPKKHQRAFMDVDMGKNLKGMRHTMSLDTTNMSNPKRFDSDTYNYVTRDSTGKVVAKGNIARGNSKYDTKKAVEYLKTKAKK
jgi:membrane protein involved in colicin uptake